MGLQLNSNEIAEILPHRYPFALVDRITDGESGAWAKGIKCVSVGEPFFCGHFPQKHVMPGVLILEALAQVGAVAILSLPENRGKIALFGGVKNARFKRQVIPGDVLELECTLTKRRGPVGIGACTATVNGDTVYPYESGKLEYYRVGDLTSTVSGTVISSNLVDYLSVTPGQVLVRIDGEDSETEIFTAQQALAEAQKRGGEVAFVDAEHALDPVYAAALGVDIDNLLVSQPDTGEQALEITDALVRSGAVDAVVVDSVAALVPKQEIEGEMGDTFVGLQARLMSQALRKLAGTINKTNCVVIFINQLRMKIGVMYGNPETTTGGNALKFYASVRLDVRRIEQIKEGGNVIGNKTRVKVVKNKVAPPFKEAVFDIMYGQGISKWSELIDLAVQMDIVQKSGSWFSMGDERIGQGKDSVKTYLQERPELAEQVEAQVRENLWRISGGAPKAPAKAAEKAVAVEADDFSDED